MGPSGCGLVKMKLELEFNEVGGLIIFFLNNRKTTLLSCLVGLNKLDSGEIYVNGSSPGIKVSNIPGLGVGFMPQVNYYGKIIKNF